AGREPPLHLSLLGPREDVAERVELDEVALRPDRVLTREVSAVAPAFEARDEAAIARPGGKTMSLTRRLDLAELAERGGEIRRPAGPQSAQRRVDVLVRLDH